MNKLFVLILTGLLVASCSKHSTSNVDRKEETPPTVNGDPTSPVSKEIPFEFSIGSDKVDESTFNEVIQNQLSKNPYAFDFTEIELSEFKFNNDRTWTFTGDSATLLISGQVCAEGETSLSLKGFQNNFERALDLSHEFTFPFRMTNRKQTLLEMPSSYSDVDSVFVQGTPNLKSEVPSDSYTQTVLKANAGAKFFYNLQTTDRKFIVTIFKPTGGAKYLSVKLVYKPTGCIGR